MFIRQAGARRRVADGARLAPLPCASESGARARLTNRHHQHSGAKLLRVLTPCLPARLPSGALSRLHDALDLPAEAIERAKEFAQYPLGKDGTLPPDSRPMPRQAAVRLAQEVGKAFAHVTLAFLELQAGGWPRDRPD